MTVEQMMERVGSKTPLLVIAMIEDCFREEIVRADLVKRQHDTQDIVVDQIAYDLPAFEKIFRVDFKNDDGDYKEAHVITGNLPYNEKGT